MDIYTRGDHLMVRTPMNYDFIAELKKLPVKSRGWDPGHRAWFVNKKHIDYVIETIRNIYGASPKLSDTVKNLVNVKKFENSVIEENSKEIDDIVLPQGPLYNFQTRGVLWAESALKRHGVMIGDAMGLGKTVQALALIDRGGWKTIVVCPSSVKTNWAKKTVEWLDGKLSVQIITPTGLRNYVTGKRPVLVSKKPQSSDFAQIVIINYELLPKYSELLRNSGFDAIVFDESHLLKNSSTIRSKAAKEIATGLRFNKRKDKDSKGFDSHDDVGTSIKKILMLTGTPILNRPKELWHQLSILDHNEFPRFFPFARKFCNAKKGAWGWDFDGASNIDELRKLIINEYVIRRRTKEVLKDMPEKIVNHVDLDIKAKDRKEYDLAEKDFSSWAEYNNMSAMALVRLGELLHLSGLSKFNAVRDEIYDFFEQRDDDEGLVVLANRRDIVAKLVEEFGHIGVSWFDGSISVDKRQEEIEKFRNGKNKLFVATIASAGTGVDGLQDRASDLWFLERTWRPSDLAQAEDRIWRIGQKNSCRIKYFTLPNSIDEHIENVLEEKSAVIKKILDGDADEKQLDIAGYVFNKLRGGKS